MATNIKVNKSIINSSSIIKHNIIIWLNSDHNYTHENIKNSFQKIQYLISSIEIFDNISECINYLKTIKNENTFMIIADSFYEQYIHGTNLIEEINQIDTVYIFCSDPLKEKFWENECQNQKGTFTNIESIIAAIEQANYPPENNHPTNSIISIVNNDFDELDPSYIYSKLLLEIILKIEYDDQAKKESFNYCRQYYADNKATVKAIDELENDYHNHSPIWWYTKESAVYRLLSSAVQTHDANMIIKMGFFMQDLHREIKRIYYETDRTTKVTLYRGHGMLADEFEKFRKREGEVFAFNWFLSTSTDQEVAMTFAKTAILDHTAIGILFEIEIDPSICSIPFACLNNHSYYFQAENEVLISAHSVYRIVKINKIEDRLWIVNLALTSDMHEQSKFLINHIRSEIYCVTHWHSLATILQKMGKYDIAIKVLQKIREITDDTDDEKLMNLLSSDYNSIGLMVDSMEKYSDALSWYTEASKILKNYLSSDHTSLATVYNNIGMVHRSLGDYTLALSNCEIALDIRLKSSSSNDTSLSNVYCNLGMIYESKGDYSEALSYYEKAYETQKSSLPPHHPFFTASYNNFGGIYSLLGDYSNALLYYTKTVEIQEKSLPADHPSLAFAYSNIGYVYQLMGKYAVALSYFEEALKIQEKLSESNLLSRATTYNNIGLVYRFMENYPTALVYLDKTLVIEEQCLPPDHPSLACTYNNLGTIYQSMKEYPTALEYYGKTLKIWQKSLPSNHPSLATIHNNIGSMYDCMEDYEQALVYYTKAIEIQKILSCSNPLDSASTYNNIGETYRAMGDHSKALSYYQKALEIEQEHLSSSHPSLAITISNMAVALEDNKQYEQAYEHAERAVDILLHSFGPNHVQTIINKNYRDQLREKLLPVN
ncbi:unnamed protein product [Rotaria socialis]|uniref:NAD(P)(+)--arginine ADP-ribosyltransferase n=5 Tax=Rotaria socialis TaxID=392032 RepID=A0A817MWL0_9BILA|nr:unnamed protein product [Rotaria socialis]CAF4331064.1 unnamed protein product [Rotaria socialis]